MKNETCIKNTPPDKYKECPSDRKSPSSSYLNRNRDRNEDDFGGRMGMGKLSGPIPPVTVIIIS